MGLLSGAALPKLDTAHSLKWTDGESFSSNIKQPWTAPQSYWLPSTVRTGPKIIKVAAEWHCTRKGCSSESLFSACLRHIFHRNSNSSLCAASFKRTAHMFVLLLPPVLCSLCDGHQNTTQRGEASFLVRNVHNSQSTTCVCCCVITKIGSLEFLIFVVLFSYLICTNQNASWKQIFTMVWFTGWLNY